MVINLDLSEGDKSVTMESDSNDSEVTNGQGTPDKGSDLDSVSLADDTPTGSGVNVVQSGSDSNASANNNLQAPAFDPDNYVHPPHMPYRVKIISPELITLANRNEHVIANKILAHLKRNGRQVTIRRSYSINPTTIIIELNDQHTMNLLLKKATWDKAPWAISSMLPDHGPSV